MLKGSLHDRTWFFDLEWVPDPDAARRLYSLSDDVPDIEAIKELWKRNGATEENPRPFVKYLFSKVVAISALCREVNYRDGERCIDFKIRSLPRLTPDNRETDEGRMIEKFLSSVGEHDPYLVGFNSSASDLQVLIQRSIIHGIAAAKFCVRPRKPWEGRDYFYRYSEEHLDLLALLSPTGKLPPGLDEMAKLCGYPGKIDIDGKHVVDLWLSGDLQKIIEYNQIDVINTYLIWLRVVHFCGRLPEQEFKSGEQTFRRFLEGLAHEPCYPHIAQFLQKWPTAESVAV